MAKTKVEENTTIDIRRSNKPDPEKDRRWIVREIHTRVETTEKTIFRASSRDKCRAFVREQKDALDAHDKGG